MDNITIERISEVAGILASLNAPAISPYELSKLIYLKGLLSNSTALKKDYKFLVDALLSIKLLESHCDGKVYLVFGHSNATPAEIVCSADPFAYVSHLSAMEYHGITDHFPKTLYMTRPSAVEWKKQSETRMQKDIGVDLDTYKAAGLPKLMRHKLNVIKNTNVHFHERSQLGAFRNVSSSPLRVATIGRVFLDMLREPKLCGGIQHVLDVYKDEAKRFLKFIVDEIDRHGQPIDKVRAGYVLNEVCELNHPIFDTWQMFAQRGGSRKLDPDSEFATHYSATWQLSINVPSLISIETDG